MAGAFVAAAIAAPLYAAIATTDAQVSAAPPCLAWFGNKDEGKCLSYSNGNGSGREGPGHQSPSSVSRKHH